MSIVDHVWGESPAADRVWEDFVGLRPSKADRRRVMALQAYIDDSKGDDSGIFVLSGYVSTAEKWAAFSQEWERLLPLAALQKSGKRRFKMSEMAMLNRMDDVAAFHRVIEEHVETSITCVLDLKILNRALDMIHAVSELPDGRRIHLGLEHFKTAWRDQFYVAFRMIMDSFHTLRDEQPDLVKHDDVVDFYFDDTPQKRVIREIWDEYLSLREPEVRQRYGKEPRFEDDEEYLPLQAADFLAWWMRKWAEEHGPHSVFEGVYPFPRKRKTWGLILAPTEEELMSILSKAIIESVDQEMRSGNLRFVPRS